MLAPLTVSVVVAPLHKVALPTLTFNTGIGLTVMVNATGVAFTQPAPFVPFNFMVSVMATVVLGDV